MSLWDHTDRLEELFKKYDFPCPKRGDLVWEDQLMDLLNTMDALINIDLMKTVQEQRDIIYKLRNGMRMMENRQRAPVPFGGWAYEEKS